MGMVSMASTLLKGFAEKVLDLDNTQVPYDQLDFISDFGSRFKFDVEEEDLKQLLKILKKKHLVDSIVVSQTNGSVIASTSDNEIKDALTGTAMLNYIQSEIPKSDTVLIRSKDWYMLFPFKRKVYIIKAGSNLSSIELRAIAKEINSFLEKQQTYLKE